MTGIDKVFAPLGNIPILLHSLLQFQNHPAIDYISLILGQHNVDQGRHLVEENALSKVCSVTVGGPRRQDSVRIGLSQLPITNLIIVHDVARPLVEAELISRGLKAVLATGVATAVLPVPDTLKSVDSDGLLEPNIINRTTFRLIQTPQIFRRAILENAHNIIEDTMTDDVTMSELIGFKTSSFEGSRLNFKITVPQDLMMARALIQSTANS